MALEDTEYLWPEELILYYDKRRVLQLLSDTNTPVAENDLEEHALALQLIRTASGLIDSRCQVGKRYSRLDLETIAEEARTADPSATDTPEKLKRFAVLQQLTADLVFGDLMARRGMAAEQMKLLAPRYEDALLKLEQLYQGETIFDLDGPKEAGVPSVAQLGRNRLNSVDFNRMFGVWPNTYYSGGPYGLFGSWRY